MIQICIVPSVFVLRRWCFNELLHHGLVSDASFNSGHASPWPWLIYVSEKAPFATRQEYLARNPSTFQSGHSSNYLLHISAQPNISPRLIQVRICAFNVNRATDRGKWKAILSNVKPWSKSKPKPMYQQTPKSNKSTPKSNKIRKIS